MKKRHSQEKVQIRQARRQDVPLILSLIRELADYEHLSDQVTATEKGLEESLFGDLQVAGALIAEYQAQTAGYAIYFHNFSTFLGRRGLYLEDLYVRPPFRRRGIGGHMLRRVARLAREHDCGRLEWAVLDWNKPAIEFYKRLGAVPLEDWTVFRLTGTSLEDPAFLPEKGGEE